MDMSLSKLQEVMKARKPGVLQPTGLQRVGHDSFFFNVVSCHLQTVREEKMKGFEKIFEAIIVENFPNMGKKIVNQVQEVQRVPNRINPRRNKPRHTLMKLTKVKHKNIKSNKGKSTSNMQGKPHRLTAGH